jgi:hypothetical protein
LRTARPGTPYIAPASVDSAHLVPLVFVVQRHQQEEGVDRKRGAPHLGEYAAHQRELGHTVAGRGAQQGVREGAAWNWAPRGCRRMVEAGGHQGSMTICVQNKIRPTTSLSCFCANQTLQVSHAHLLGKLRMTC